MGNTNRKINGEKRFLDRVESKGRGCGQNSGLL